MKKILLLLLAAVLCTSVVSAAGIPSLFHNDDAWYKDGVSPMIEREGKRYIPADIFTMFDYMSVTTPTAANLLIHNTDSGQYVSILFMQQSALINGTVHENIGVLRDGGVYYVEADAVCEGLGFTTRLYTGEDGAISMQICDSSVISTSFDALAESYLPSEEEDSGYTEEENVTVEEPDSAGLIYLFCAEPDGNAEFTAQDALDDEKLAYTLFLDGESDVRTLIRQSIDGICGLDLPEPDETGTTAEQLNAINDGFCRITRWRVSLTRSAGDDAADEALRNAGYYPVKPDFEVNGGSEPDALLGEILAAVDERGWCTVWLEDCWNTVEMARLIRELNENEYRTANFAHSAKQ